MKKIIYFIIILAIIFITSCSADDGSHPGVQSYFYVVTMDNAGDSDVHMFVSSEGETFGQSNKLKPGESRTYKKLIEKPYERDFTVSVGRNSVVFDTKTKKLSSSDYSFSIALDEYDQLMWSK